jgi:hypothetical protein
MWIWTLDSCRSGYWIKTYGAQLISWFDPMSYIGSFHEPKSADAQLIGLQIIKEWGKIKHWRLLRRSGALQGRCCGGWQRSLWRRLPPAPRRQGCRQASRRGRRTTASQRTGGWGEHALLLWCGRREHQRREEVTESWADCRSETLGGAGGVDGERAPHATAIWQCQSHRSWSCYSRHHRC